MKKLLIAILFLFPALALAAVFDFSNGQPAVMDDGTVSDSFEQTRYDFTNGQPAPVFDTTATQAVTDHKDEIIINYGHIQINYGHIIIQ